MTGSADDRTAVEQAAVEQADDRAPGEQSDETRRRVAWARAAQERARGAAKRLLWAQGFSSDAKRRAAAAERVLQDRRTPGPRR